MHKKLILSSILAIGVIGAAHAATNTGSFPNDGKMLEDWTYTNAANETNVGTDGGNVNALANYTWNEIALPAGKYLPADTDGLIANLLDCTSGNYCAGSGANTVHYNQSQAQGLTACPTEFGTSAVGSTTDTDCYRACNISNMTTTSNPNGTIANIAHAATLSGNDYYGNGTDTCEAATCEVGCRLIPGTSSLPFTNRFYAEGVDTDNNGNRANGSGYPRDYGIDGQRNAFAVDYGDGVGVISGHGRCSTQSGTNNDYTWTNPTTFSSLTDETGQSGAQYCYCQLDGFTPYNGTKQTISTPWVFAVDMNNNNECSGHCTNLCRAAMQTGSDDDYRLFHVKGDGFVFRSVVSAYIEPIFATCEWNMVTVSAGKYLPANTDGLIENLASCTTGNYCTGLQSQVHYESTAQGLTASCSTLGDHTYTNSVAGASADTQCYKSCALATANVAHAATVGGKDYYGNGVDTCYPTSCATGYEPYNIFDDRTEFDYLEYDYWSGDDETVALYYYGDTTGVPNDSSIPDISYFSAQFKIIFSNYAPNSDNFAYANLQNDNTGRYVYIKLIGLDFEGNTRIIPAPWKLVEDLQYSHCEDEANCLERIYEMRAIKDDIIRTVLNDPSLDDVFNTFLPQDVKNSITQVCVAKTYNITWADTLAADVTANEAATATYGGNINTPVKIDPSVFQTTQKGKHFTGWTFQQPQQSPIVQDPS